MCETAFVREDGKIAAFPTKPRSGPAGVAQLATVHPPDYLQEPPIDHAA